MGHMPLPTDVRLTQRGFHNTIEPSDKYDPDYDYGMAVQYYRHHHDGRRVRL